MTPAEYLGLIVLPTFDDLLADPADQRRAYLACITAAHLVDYVAVTLPRRPDGKPDIRAVRSRIGAVGPAAAGALGIVEAVSNGTKHAQPDPKPSRPVKFVPGREQVVPAFQLDVPGAGFDEGRFDKPGLAVVHDGEHWFLDDCVAATLSAFLNAFPTEFAGRSFDPHPDGL